MKAIRIHEHGGTDRVIVDEMAAPSPGARQVLVRIKATSINHLDIWVRYGLPNLNPPLPMILGSDGAGIVAEIGSEIADLKVGDRVLVSPGKSCGVCRDCMSGHDNLCRSYQILGEHCDGTDAEYVSINRQDVIKLPESVAFLDAAASSLVFVTAYQMLVEKANVQPFEDVLVLGASSGVGTAAIQIAKLFKARVIAVAGSEVKLEKARQLGADETINYNSERIFEAVRRLTQKKGVEIVFENTGAATWKESIFSAARGGRIVTCGATTGPESITDLRYVFSRQLTIYGSTMGSKSLLFTMLDLMKRNEFKSVIHEALPFTEVRKGHEIIEKRQQFGKVVLEF